MLFLKKDVFIYSESVIEIVGVGGMERKTGEKKGKRYLSSSAGARSQELYIHLPS